MSDLLKMTATEARNSLLKKEISSVELLNAYQNAMEKTEALNNYVTPTLDVAKQMALNADKAYAQGSAGPLAGLPIGVKDLFCTKDIETTACSAILKGFLPSYESTVTSNIWQSGGVMLGKLNCDEFAMGSSNETSIFGPAVNPWSKIDGIDLSSGGSSGGSASSVAAGSALMSLGTDTGGSIRQPAAFCGVVGLKPTYGRCSRWGIVAFASSLDQAGPFTRTVEDSALIFSVMAGHDPKDSTSASLGYTNFSEAVKSGIEGLRIGIPAEYNVDGMDIEISDLWKRGRAWLEQAGAKIVDINLPHTKYALPCYYIIAPAEASSNLARYDGVRYGKRIEAETLDAMYEATRADGFGEEVQRRILIGTYALSAGYYDAYYLKAQQVRRLIKEDFEKAFNDVDAILTPTTPTPAFPLGAEVSDPITMYLNDVFTVPANLAGLPGISVPAGLSKQGLPLGLQLLAPPFEEGRLFSVANAIEKQAEFLLAPARAAGDLQ